MQNLNYLIALRTNQSFTRRVFQPITNFLRFKETSLKSPSEVENFVDDVITITTQSATITTGSNQKPGSSKPKLPSSIELTVPFTSFKPKPTKKPQSNLWRPSSKPINRPSQAKPGSKPTSKPNHPSKPTLPVTNNHGDSKPTVENIEVRPIMHTTYTSDQAKDNENESYKPMSTKTPPKAPVLPPLPSYSPPEDQKQWCDERLNIDCNWFQAGQSGLDSGNWNPNTYRPGQPGTNQGHQGQNNKPWLPPIDHKRVSIQHFHCSFLLNFLVNILCLMSV